MLNGKNLRRTLKITLKILVTSGFLLWLADKIHIDQILQTWDNTNWFFLAPIAVIIFLVCIVINTLRWQLLLKPHGIDISLWYLLVIYTKAAFLGSYLPGGIAIGDIYRMYSLAKDTGNRTISISSVLVERAMGIFSLISISLLTFYYSIFFKVNTDVFLPLLNNVIGVTVLFVFFGMSFIILIKKGYIENIKSNNAVILKVKSLTHISVSYLSKRVFVKIFLLSVVLQFTIVFWTYTVAKALDISIPLYALCICIPLITFFALLPISVGGFGIREAAYVFFLVPFGLEPFEAVSLSLLSVLIQAILRGLSGVVFFLNTKAIVPASKSEI